MQQAPVSKPEGRTTCTLIPGDGIGPELMYSVMEVFKVFDLLTHSLIHFSVPFLIQASGAPVDFEQLFVSEVNPIMSAPLEDVISSIDRNGICIKGTMRYV